VPGKSFTSAALTERFGVLPPEVRNWPVAGQIQDSVNDRFGENLPSHCAMQARLDAHPETMRARRQTVGHPFGTLKARMGATHFVTRTLPRVRTEMSLQVLAYNLKRMMAIMGRQSLMAALRA